MPMWRCPHCGTPQAETARCWVCRRSSTACLTCRHFRRSVAAKLGYCGLDARRLPLIGDEIRPCWEAGPLPDTPAITVAATPGQGMPDRPSSRLAFVEVGATVSEPPMGRDGSASRSDPASTDATATAAFDRPEPRWSLWED